MHTTQCDYTHVIEAALIWKKKKKKKIMAAVFHTDGNTPSLRHTLKIFVRGMAISKANSLISLIGISFG
jgi:hypothetical protein